MKIIPDAARLIITDGMFQASACLQLVIIRIDHAGLRCFRHIYQALQRPGAPFNLSVILDQQQVSGPGAPDEAIP